MVKLIFFDTETTGLPTKRNVSALESSKIWPDLVSIAWMVFEDKRLIHSEYHIIKPNGWVIPQDSIKFHKITNEIAKHNGDVLSDVLSKFKADIENAHLIVAHNMEFDRNVIFNAYKWRLNIDPTTFWQSDIEFCSLLKGTDEMKLPSKSSTYDTYKFVSLKELYEDTFKRSVPPNAHDAKRDVDILQQIVFNRWITFDKEGRINSN